MRRKGVIQERKTRCGNPERKESMTTQATERSSGPSE